MIGELDHLEAGVITLRMAVIEAQGQLPLHRPRALLPELFDGFAIKMGVALRMDDPGSLAKLEPIIEGFQAGECFDHL